MRERACTFIMLIALVLTACGASPAAGGDTAPGELAAVPAEYAGKTNPLGAEGAAAGATLFATNCTPCHGEQGHGDGPIGASLVPQPKNLPELASVAEDDYLFWRISIGKPGTSMMPWKGALTDDQIWQIIAFIRTLK